MAVQITKQPQSVCAAIDGEAKFTIEVTGDVSYVEWQKSTDLSTWTNTGIKNKTIQLLDLTSSDSETFYRCSIKDSTDGSIYYSSPVELFVFDESFIDKIVRGADLFIAMVDTYASLRRKSEEDFTILIEQIQAALDMKSNKGHIHDTRYYTKDEINMKYHSIVIDGVQFLDRFDINHTTKSYNNASDAAKTANLLGFKLQTGAEVNVSFQYLNTAENPTLNISGTGAKEVYINGSRWQYGALLADTVYHFVYDGNVYHVVGESSTHPIYTVADLSTIADKSTYYELSVSLPAFRPIAGTVVTLFLTGIGVGDDKNFRIHVEQINDSSYLVRTGAGNGATPSYFYGRGPYQFVYLDGGILEVVGTPPAQYTIDGVSQKKSGLISHYTTCTTAAATAAKTASLLGYELVVGSAVDVMFTNVNTAENPTLNINGTGPIRVFVDGELWKYGALKSGIVYRMVYDGSNYNVIGNSGSIPYFATVANPADFTSTTDCYLLTLSMPGFRPINGTTLYLYIYGRTSLDDKNVNISISEIAGSSYPIRSGDNNRVPPLFFYGNGLYQLTFVNGAFEISGTPPAQFTIDGVSAKKSGNISHYTVSSTAAATAAKTATLLGYELIPGSVVNVTFTTLNTAENPTLNINGTGAVDVYINGERWQYGALAAGIPYYMVYTGARYEVLGESQSQPMYASVELSNVSNASSYYLLTISMPRFRPIAGTTFSLYINANNSSSDKPIRICIAEINGSNYVIHSGDNNVIEPRFFYRSGIFQFTYVGSNTLEVSSTPPAQYIVDGVSQKKSGNISHYTTSSTAAATAEKTATLLGYELVVGSSVDVKFSYVNTTASPTLNINGTGAKEVYINGRRWTYGELRADTVYRMVYDGTRYHVIGDASVQPIFNVVDITSVTDKETYYEISLSLPGFKAIDGTEISMLIAGINSKTDKPVKVTVVQIPNSIYTISSGESTTVTPSYFDGNGIYQFVFVAGSTATDGTLEIASTPPTQFNIDGVRMKTHNKIMHHTTCSTAADTAEKTASISEYTLFAGSKFTISFTNVNTNANPTLNISGTGAKDVYINGQKWQYGALRAGIVYEIVYDGSKYNVIGEVGPTTLYANMDMTSVSSTDTYYLMTASVPGFRPISGTTVNLNITGKSTLSDKDIKISISEIASSAYTIRDGSGNTITPDFFNSTGVYQLTYTSDGNFEVTGFPPAQYDIDGVNLKKSGNIKHYAVCSTAAGTAAKAVTLRGYELSTGARVTVLFSATNTAANPTLNVNGTGAKAIYYRNAAITTGFLRANRVYSFVYDGSQYELIGDVDNIHGVYLNGYYGLASPLDDASSYIRTTSSGLIPYQSGTGTNANGTIGTNAWRFKESYIETMHGVLDGTLQNTRKIDGVNFNASKDIAHLGTCSTDAATADKTATIDGFNLVTGAEATIIFTTTNTADNPTLNISNTGAKAIYYRNAAITTGFLRANRVYRFVYDGAQFELVGDADAIRGKMANGFYGMTSPLDEDNVWIRTTSKGILPYNSGTGTSTGTNIGTSSWVFANAYIDTTHGKLDGTLTNTRKIDGVNFNAGSDIAHYGYCETAAATADKVVALTGFNLVTGAEVTVKFKETNTADNPKLNINSTGAKAIFMKGTQVVKGFLQAGRVYKFVYDGTNFEVIGDFTSFNGLSINDKTITYTRIDGTTGTITTQDYRVKNVPNNSTKFYLTGTTSATETTTTQIYDTNVFVDTTAGELHATTFVGKMKTPHTLDGVDYDSSANITHYGVCSTDADTAAKTVALTSYKLDTGSRVIVKFTVTNTAANPTLNVNSTGAKAIFMKGTQVAKGFLQAGRVYEFIYDGTNYEVVGDFTSFNGLSINDKTITYTRIDGTTGTITTQDYRVKNVPNTSTKYYLVGTTSATETTATQIYDTNVYVDTTAGKLHATTFDGKMATARKIDGVNFDASTDIIHFATCSTAAATAEKAATITGFNLVTGAEATIKFTVTNTADNPKLNISNGSANTGAKAITMKGAAVAKGFLQANRIYKFVYDGTNYEVIGDFTSFNGLSISDKTITYTRIDGTTGTITTQDYRVKTENANTTKAYVTGTTAASAGGTLIYDDKVYLDTTNGTLTATSFNGLATKATADASNQTITSTYIKALSISDKTITYTKGDGTTTGTITTQDYRVKATPKTDTKYYLAGTTSATETTGTLIYDTNAYINTGAGELVVKKVTSDAFVGPITGNVTGDITGNAGTATTLKNTRKIDGVNFNGGADIAHYAECTTAVGTAAKTATITGFNLVTGAVAIIKFTNGNNVANPTLNISNGSSNTGAKNIFHKGAAMDSAAKGAAIRAGGIYELVYDGTQYNIVGNAYIAGTGITLDATSITNAGVRAVSKPSNTNGVISVNTNGTSGNVTVYELPTASSSVLGGVKVGTSLGISSGVLNANLTDNLTSTSTTSALTANMGKSLQDNKQPKTLATALTIAGASKTTVEAALGALNDGKMGIKFANGYYGMASPSNADDVWIRTTTLGLIPYKSGSGETANGSLGTTGWRFADAYINTTYGNLSGNATTATTLQTARTIDGVSFNGGAAITHFAVCDTAAGTAAKTVAVTGFTLVTGAEVTVLFSATNTAANPTLNVNSTGAKAIYYRNAAISAGYLAQNRVYRFIYDGSQYELIGDLDTTYAAGNGLQLSSTTFSIKVDSSNARGLSTSANGLALALATTSAAGAMSSDDKTKLNNIAANANNYSLPKATTSALGGVIVGTNLAVDANGKISGNYSAASQSAAGLMSADDKKKLDGIATSANNYSLPTASSSTKGGIKVGTGLSISNEVLSNSGITSLAIGDGNNGTTKVNGTNTTIVKGLGSAAFTESTAYAAASHGTHVTYASSGTPAALGTASNGSATTVARSDHVHPKPSLSDLGAASSSHTHNAFTAASTSASGSAGFVPAPGTETAAAPTQYFLASNGTWQKVVVDFSAMHRTSGTVTNTDYYHRNIAFGTSATPKTDATYGASGAMYVYYT